jgi:hypothetical protein
MMTFIFRIIKQHQYHTRVDGLSTIHLHFTHPAWDNLRMIDLQLLLSEFSHACAVFERSYSRLTNGDSTSSESWQVASCSTSQQTHTTAPGQKRQQMALTSFGLRLALRRIRAGSWQPRWGKTVVAWFQRGVSCTHYYVHTGDETTGIHVQNYHFPAVRCILEYPENLLKLFRSSSCDYKTTPESLDGFSCNSIQEGFTITCWHAKILVKNRTNVTGHPTRGSRCVPEHNCLNTYADYKHFEQRS